MADPLLTTLCSVCHIQPWRYKCPRDGALTCGLACTRKHKAWAACSGIRDVTAFLPKSVLKTRWGIDHDYNFLAGVERSRQRTEREFAARGFEGLDNIHDNPARFREDWKGDVLRFIPATHFRGRGGARGRGRGGSLSLARATADAANGVERTPLQMKLQQVTRAANIDLVWMPKGLSRQRENGSDYFKRSGLISWQVEWLVYEDGLGVKPTRILRKARENIPVYQALAETMEWLIKGQEARDSGLREYGDDDEEDAAPAHKRRKRHHHRRDYHGPMQSSYNSTWHAVAYPAQNPFTGTWDQDNRATIGCWARQAETEERRKLRYYLLIPRTNPKELVPLDCVDTMSTALPGRTVHEFPTICVLPDIRRTDLPPGHTLGSTKRTTFDFPAEIEREDPKRANRPPLSSANAVLAVNGKRNFGHGPATSDRNGQQAKRRKVVSFAKEVDDGEIDSDGEDVAMMGTPLVQEVDEDEGAIDDDSTTSSEGEDSDDPSSDEAEEGMAKDEGVIAESMPWNGTGSHGGHLTPDSLAQSSPAKLQAIHQGKEAEAAADFAVLLSKVEDDIALLQNIEPQISSSDGKKNLVVYDSWSESE